MKPPRRPEGGDEPSRGAPRNGAGTASADALDRLLDEVERAPWAYDYFALLKANPKLRDVLALGERIVFRDGERIVQIKPAPAK